MKKLLSISAALLFAAMLLARPEDASNAVRGALSLCAKTVIPSLFPFFAVSTFLLQMGISRLLQPIAAPLLSPLFRIRGECAAPLLAGLLGGYPAGARAAAELHRQGTLTKGEAEQLLAFCNNCSPGFLLGFLGADILGSVRAGTFLLLIHAASAMLSGILLCRLPRREETPLLPAAFPAEQVSLPKAFTAAVSSALGAALTVSAYVVLFRTIAALLPPLPAAVLGGLEMVSGAAMLHADEGGFVTASAFAAWGGFSIHCQTAAVADGLSLRYHTAGKLLQSVFSLALAAVAAPWIYR